MIEKIIGMIFTLYLGNKARVFSILKISHLPGPKGSRRPVVLTVKELK
jgi:hypothetical protein